MDDKIKLTKLANCAGCGAKVGAGVLAKLLDGLKVRTDPNLLVGFDKSDDASVYKVSDDLALVQTVDFFPPIADDPYTFGAIAATNALSDVYAMGGEPKLALNIMAVPASLPKDAVHQILHGGYDKAYEAGAIITGGHSILDDEPKYGLAVTGFVHPDKVLTNSGAKDGDVLLLTKPLGIGILTTAAKADLVSEDTMAYAVRLMTPVPTSPASLCSDTPARWLRAATSRYISPSAISTSSPRLWISHAPASYPRVCTATAALPRHMWTQAIPSLRSRICSTTPRPQAACSSPSTPTTQTPCSRSCDHPYPPRRG